MPESAQAWRDFYAAVANAGAALLGLVFVGVSIQLSRRRLDTDTRLLGLEAMANLLYPVLVALVMLLPISPGAQGACLLVLSAVGLPAIVYIAWYSARAPRAEPAIVLAYRYILPVLATLLGAAGAIGLIVGWSIAVYGPPVFVFLMFVVGTQNAWDLLLGARSRLGLVAWSGRDRSGVRASVDEPIPRATGPFTLPVDAGHRPKRRARSAKEREHEDGRPDPGSRAAGAALG